MTLTAITVFKQDEIQKKFKQLLWERASSFLTSVMWIVANNDLLKKAEPQSVYMSAMVAATLDLPVNQNLWFAYIIPYKDNKNNKVVAQFQMGYKGFIQLALRSWQFKTISATPVYEWQIVEADPLKGYVFDWNNKESDKIVWYASYFSLINWFEKYLYMTREELEKHWKKFSQSYKKSYWLREDDFDSMATKTVIKLLLSKYAPLSVDMQKAIISDQWVLHDEELNEVEYVDNDQEEILAVDMEEKLKEITPAKEDDSKQESLLVDQEKDVK